MLIFKPPFSGELICGTRRDDEVKPSRHMPNSGHLVTVCAAPSTPHVVPTGARRPALARHSAQSNSQVTVVRTHSFSRTPRNRPGPSLDKRPPPKRQGTPLAIGVPNPTDLHRLFLLSLPSPCLRKMHGNVSGTEWGCGWVAGVRRVKFWGAALEGHRLNS